MQGSVIYCQFANIEDVTSSESENVAVVIILQDGKKPKTDMTKHLIVYDMTDIDNMDEAVARNVYELTLGCGYRYKLVKKIANVYFYK